MTMPQRPDQAGRPAQPLSPGGLSIAQILQQGLLTNADMIALGLMKDTTGQGINTTLGVPAQTGDIAALHATGNTIAEDIAAAGTPPLILHTLKLSVSGHSIAGSGGSYSQPLFFGQPSYSVGLYYISNGSGGNPFGTVELLWEDETTGYATAHDRYAIAIPASSTAVAFFSLRGSVKADKAIFSITNYDSVSMTVQQGVVAAHSQPLTEDTCLCDFSGAAPNGYTMVTGDASSGLIGATSPGSIAAGTTQTRLLYTPWTGQIFLHSRNPSASNPLKVTLNVIDPVISLPTSEIYSAILAAGDGADEIIALPRMPVLVSMTNQGSSGTISPIVTAVAV